ncbi:MAG: glycoside hydrolase family 97 catalytic domain-containing protein [Opitutae bacterium]|nr:glycoside hydrolase family 97 catalytic domain-containing protein [Opitutae bacterium]
MKLPRLFCGALVLATSLHAGDANWQVESPNGELRLVVRLGEIAAAGEPQKHPARLSFRVEHGPAATRAVVLGDSPLGLTLGDQDFRDGLQFVSADAVRTVEENYLMPHGKRRVCRNTAHALTLHFRNRQGAALDLDLRAYHDGVAFRYRLPGADPARHTVQAEHTGFALPPDARLWLQPSDKPGVYSPGYETYYEDGIAAGTPAPTDQGWAFPVLFRTADAKHWGLITEANATADYCATRLAGTAADGVYRVRLPDPEEGNGHGPAEPTSALPWAMPWRVIILGPSPGTIVESTLVNDLSASSAVTDPSWIRPGRVAWSWWSDQASSRDGAKQKRFIDFAAEMGWEYVLVDANWPIMDNGNIHDVIRHAREKGVGVLLWYNSGGPNNVVTEKPRDSLFYPAVRRAELKQLRDWGVKGIKVDFLQSDKQASLALYRDILQDAAEFGIMVNFHGCTLPRGWSRTYPNLMSMEAVRGEENYLFEATFPERAPAQNTITPFTRNAVGPMDYTPMALGHGRYPHLTTYAHELALTVLFESGWVHFADDADVYRRLPEAPKRFIQELPVAWDDTRFVAGYPGQSVVLARRHGQAWYLAGVNGRDQPLEQTLDLTGILPAGDYEFSLIADGADATQFAAKTQPIASRDLLKVTLLPFGGFVAKLTPR